MADQPALDPAAAEARVARWVERAVIGLGFCPFAAVPWKAGAVRIAISEAADVEGAIRATMEEAERLLNEDTIATTLVVFPLALDDFDDLLDAAAGAEALLERAGARGVLQVASFHPGYRFEGTEPADLGNYTNRAPFPILHLLREEQVSAAVDQHPDPERIPAENIARLQTLGRAQVEALWEEL